MSTTPTITTEVGEPRPSSLVRSSLRGVYIIWYRDLLRWWRDRQRILPSLVQPVLYLFVFGVGLSSAMGGGGGAATLGVNYTTFMYPGVLTMGVLFTSMFSAMSIVWDREFGFLKEIQVAPIPRAAVAVGKALGGSTQAILQATLIVAMAPLAGVTVTPLMLVKVLALMFLLAFALASIGVALASRMKTMEGFQMIVNFFMMPMLFLSGAFFPLQGLPAWLSVLTHLDPAAYAVDAIRRVVLEAAGVQPEMLNSLAITGPSGAPLDIMFEAALLVVFSAIGLFLAIRWFGETE